MAFKMKAGKEGPMKKNFPGMYGMKPVEETGSAMMMKKEASMKMKKEAPMKVAKPDFPDIDGDGNTKESMKQAAADKKSANKMKKAPMKLKKKSASKMKSPMKIDDKKKKSKADIKLDSLLTPASQDTMKYKTSPGFVDYLKRNDFTSSDIVNIIKNTDKKMKKNPELFKK